MLKAIEWRTVLGVLLILAGSSLTKWCMDIAQARIYKQGFSQLSCPLVWLAFTSGHMEFQLG